MKKILITGYAGYIGNNLLTYFKSKDYYVYGIDILESDDEELLSFNLTNYKKTESVLKKMQPDIIIHLAGMKNLTECEKTPELAEKVNFGITDNICKIIEINNLKCHMIFISTDYVFAGTKGNYFENSKPDPRTVYGITKLMAENRVKKLHNYSICRTSNVFGKGGGFIDFLLAKSEKKETIYAYTNAKISPTYIKYLMNCLESIIKNKLFGIFHISGKEHISRYDFALKINEIFNLNAEIQTAKIGTKSFIAKESTLNSEYSRKQLNCYSPDVDFALKNMIGNIEMPYFYFKDKRGIILGLSNMHKWEEVNYIESNKGVVRGNHYHKKTEEGIFLISGKIKVTYQNLLNNTLWEATYKKGDFFIIEPHINHTFNCLENSTWVNMLTKKMDNNKDIHHQGE